MPCRSVGVKILTLSANAIWSSFLSLREKTYSPPVLAPKTTSRFDTEMQVYWKLEFEI